METYRAALALVAGDPAGTVAHADLAIARGRARRRPHRRGRVGPVRARLVGRRGPRGGPPRLLRRRRGPASAPATSPTCSAARSRWATSGSPRGGSATPCAPTRTRSGSPPATRSTGRCAGTADMLVGLSQIAFERGDLEAAAAHLTRVDELGERLGLPQIPYRWRVARARLREAQGDLAGAVALLEEAERVYVGDFSPNVRPGRGAAGAGAAARRAAWPRRSTGPARSTSRPDDELSYVREYEHVTLARILLRQHGRRRAGPAHGVRAARAAPGRGRGGRADRHPDRDPRAAGARPPREHGRHDVRARSPPGAGAPAGRAGGLRAGLRRRGRADRRTARGPRRAHPTWALPPSPARRVRSRGPAEPLGRARASSTR